MAITVGERWQDRGGGVDDQGVRTLRRGWWVKTDDDAVGVPAVIDAVVAQFPAAALFASHPEWPRAICRGPKAEPGENARTWKVKAEYSTAPFPAKGDGGAGGGGGTPMSGLGAPDTDAGSETSPTSDASNERPANERPPTVSVAKKEVSVPFEEDVVTGEPHLNTVGDSFIPPVEVFRSHEIITFKFSRKPEDMDWANRRAYRDTVNSNAPVIFGVTYPAGTLRVLDYSFDTVWDTGSTGLELFFAFTVQLEYKPDGWKISTLNAGRRKRKDGAGPYDPEAIVYIRDTAGQVIADPIPLNEDGSVADVGGPYHYVEHDGYVPIDFNADPGLLA